MFSRLKDRLAGAEPVYACWSGFRDPLVAEAIAVENFDVIVLDAQHGFHDEASILECISPIVSAGKSPLVRIPLNRWDMAQKVLDFGALGVVAPMINTREDARAFAESCKYPTLGARSYAPRHAATLYGMEVDDYLHKTVDCTFSLAQIETREAYENLDEILSVDGLDGILMGPSDFSIFMTGNTVPDPYGEATVDAVADIAKRTLAAGKIPATFTISPEHTKLTRDMGYKLISITMDGMIVSAGAKAALSGVG